MIVISPPTNTSSWNTLINKPNILSDNQIDWSEIQNIPPKVAFLGGHPGFTSTLLFADDGTNWFQPVSDTPLSVHPYSFPLRTWDGMLYATNFRATNLPNSPSGLPTGYFYHNNGSVKVVL